jgi:AbrB family looped-hinge helix DNA binding protein
MPLYNGIKRKGGFAVRTTLDRFGRIVIPKRMRKDLGIEPGAQVTVEEHGQTIYVKPVQDVPPVAVKEGILVYRGTVEGDLGKAVSADREDRRRKLSKGLRK